MMARWWLRSPLTIRALVGLAVLVPFLLALPYPMFGHPVDPFGGLAGLGGPIGVLIAARFRDLSTGDWTKEPAAESAKCSSPDSPPAIRGWTESPSDG
jgi:hypothetical protein